MASAKSQKNQPSDSATYAWQRIESDIRAKVRDGRLPAGTMLASRQKLAREYGVALSTAQQAIAGLIADGTLETLDRRGTFVAHPSRRGTAVQNDPAPGENSPGPSHPAVSRLTPPATSAMLGIVATARIDPMEAADTGSLWAHQAIRALEKVFAAAGGTTRFFDRYPPERGPYPRGIDDTNAISMSAAIRALCDEGADTLAVVALCDGRDMSDEIVAAVDVERVPAVYVSWHEVRPPLAQVYYDSNFAGYQAAQHLLRKGYRRLLFLNPFREDWLADRIGGARDAIRHAGLPPEALVLYPGEPSHDTYDRDLADRWAYEAARQAFAEDNLDIFGGGAAAPGRWGILAPNDFTAYGVLRAAEEIGKTAGVDYGLVGFDDDPQSYALGLSTVRPPIEAMGEEAGRMLLRALHGEPGGQQIRLRSQVIARVSTAASLTGGPRYGGAPAERLLRKEVTRRTL